MFMSKKLSNTERYWTIAEKELASIVFCLEHLRNLILGFKIVIVTDHYNLINIYHATLKIPKLVRMAIKISEYGPDLVFQCGRDNITADYLSRQVFKNSKLDEEPNVYMIESAEVLEFKKEEIPQYYESDVFCQNIIQKLGENLRIQLGRKEFTKEDGFLYVQIRDGDKRIIVPEKLTSSLIHSVHVDPLNGHPGINHTLNKINFQYYIPNVGKKVTKYVKGCLSCNQNKSAKVFRPQLGLFKKSYIPFDSVHIDLVGPLYTENNQKKYVLTTVCRLTRYCEMCILNDKSALEVSRGLIDSVFSRHSISREIFSDLGAEFNNSLLQEIGMFMGYKQKFTTAYTPSSNGLAERQNQEIGKYIRLISDKHMDWERYIYLTMHAVNTTVNRITGRSPFNALYFRDPSRTYYFLGQISNLNESLAKEKNIKNMFGIAKTIFFELGNLIQENTKKYWAKENTPKFDDKVFSPGDLVYVKNMANVEINSKLQVKFRGPFRILSMVSENIFNLMYIPTGKIFRTHGNKLKLAHANKITETENKNANRAYPTEIEFITPDDGLLPITNEQLVMTGENYAESKLVPNSFGVVDMVDFAIHDIVFDRDEILNISLIDYLEIEPDDKLKLLFERKAYLNVYVDRKKYKNTTLTPVPGLGTMGTYIKKKGKTRRENCIWLFIYSALLGNKRNVYDLLVSKVLDNEYKYYLQFNTSDNILLWSIRGLRDIFSKELSHKEDKNYEYVILHLNKDMLLSFTMKEKLNHVLNQLQEEIQSKLLINVY